MTKETYQTSLRLDLNLYERIKADADKDKRSVSKQIEYMLIQFYETKERYSK